MLSHHLIVLAVIQGLTEFIPVSSSGHLAVTSKILNWPDQGLCVDATLHLGTLLAVIGYFWRDILLMIRGFFCYLKGNKNHHGQLASYLVIATIPAVIIGVLFNQFIGEHLRSLNFIGSMTIIFGILLYLTDKIDIKSKNLMNMGYRQAIIVGFAQSLALMPGVSRSGICMTMLRWLGFNRTDTARFAFLMSIPVIVGACVHTAFKMSITQKAFFTQDLCIGILISFTVGLMTIHLMLKWLAAHSLQFFAIYRIILGGGLLIYANF